MILPGFSDLDTRLVRITAATFLGIEILLFAGLFILGEPFLTLVIAAGLAVAIAAFFKPEIGFYLCLAMVYSVVSATYLGGLFKVTALYAISVLLLSRLYSREGLISDPVNKAVLTFSILAIISLGHVVSMKLGLESLVEFLKALILFALASNLLREKKAMRSSFWVIVAAAVYVAGTNLHDLVKNPLNFAVRIRGLFGDPNNLAMVLVSSVPFCYALMRSERRASLRAIAFLAAAVIVAAVVPTLSRGGLLALAVVLALIIYMERNNRLLFWGSIVALVACTIVFYYKFGFGFALLANRLSSVDKSLLQRYRLYKGGIAMFLDHPFFGVGIGNFLVHSTHYTKLTVRLFAHNMYIHVAAELGVLALLTFTGTIIVSWVRLAIMQRSEMVRADRILFYQARGIQLALTAMSVSGMFLSQHFNKILWMLLGMSVALIHMQAEKPSQ